MTVQRYSARWIATVWQRRQPLAEGVEFVLAADHERAMAEAHTLMGGAIESAIKQERVEVIRECIAVVEALPHEDACCSRGCACQTWDKRARCDLSCNCSFWTLPHTVAALRALLPEEER